MGPVITSIFTQAAVGAVEKTADFIVNPRDFSQQPLFGLGR